LRPLLFNGCLRMASRLSFYERKRIKYLREIKKDTRREIGIILWRDHSVLSKEYNRNKKRWWHYDPEYANIRTKQRTYWKKKQCKKIRMDNELESYILKKLEIWRTAEKAAGRRNKIDRKICNDRTKTSWISIRRYIDSKFGSYIKYILIQEKKLKKYKKREKRWKRKWGKIKHRIFIDIRPKIIGTKKEIWHFEVDFIESIKWDKTVILTLIDKASRKKFAYKLPDKKSDRVLKILKKIIKKYSVKSMTFDNDNWFAKHYKLWILTYFCHTYSSREKWQVENGNRGYRKFFPKKTKLKNISQKDVDYVTDYLNNLPMKCLSFLTPNEFYEKEISKLNTNILLKKSLVQ